MRGIRFEMFNRSQCSVPVGLLVVSMYELEDMALADGGSDFPNITSTLHKSCAEFGILSSKAN